MNNFDWMNFDQSKSVLAYYRQNTDLVPTKYRLVSKNPKKKVNFFVSVGISSVLSRYDVGNKLYPIIGFLKNW